MTSRDCSSIAAGPTFVVSSCLIAVGFRGYQFPRTAGHFVFVRPVEFDEQTTSPSRPAQLSGASPVFPIPNPLSGWLLEAVFSVHFQEFQALQALAGSYSPHAVTGTYTLLLSARLRTSRRDPVHPLLPCQTPPSIPSRLHVRPCRLRPKTDVLRPRSCPACLRGGFSSRICAFPGSQVARRRRTSTTMQSASSSYRIQQIRSSHWVMNPMVTGISAPGALVTTHRPFPNRTDSPGTSVPGCNFCPGVFRPVR